MQLARLVAAVWDPAAGARGDDERRAGIPDRANRLCARVVAHDIREDDSARDAGREADARAARGRRGGHPRTGRRAADPLHELSRVSGLQQPLLLDRLPATHARSGAAPDADDLGRAARTHEDGARALVVAVRGALRMAARAYPRPTCRRMAAGEIPAWPVVRLLHRLGARVVPSLTSSEQETSRFLVLADRLFTGEGPAIVPRSAVAGALSRGRRVDRRDRRGPASRHRHESAVLGRGLAGVRLSRPHTCEMLTSPPTQLHRPPPPHSTRRLRPSPSDPARTCERRTRRRSPTSTRPTASRSRLRSRWCSGSHDLRNTEIV